MRILLITPAPANSRKGNRVTAHRWARMLRQLGHRVQVEENYDQQRCDLCVALHARKSAASIRRFRQDYPDKPIVLSLTGTDLYGDIHTNKTAQQSLELADRLVLLQPHGIGELPPHLHAKARVIYQSEEPVPNPPQSLKRAFEVCVCGHLRPVKDPFRTAMAARHLPAESNIQITHLGAALSKDMERRARTETQRNPRYRWLGEKPHGTTRRLLARSRLLVVSSKLEGGANVISEALAAGVPILSSRISGSIGILGEDYSGYFPVGDTAALAKSLRKCEVDSEFYNLLREQCKKAAKLIEPARELDAWRKLLGEFK